MVAIRVFKPLGVALRLRDRPQKHVRVALSAPCRWRQIQLRPCSCRKFKRVRALGSVALNLSQNVKAMCTREIEHVQGLGLAVRARLSAKARSGRPSFCGLLTTRCSRSPRPHRRFSLFLAPSPGWSKLDGSTAECSRNYLEFFAHSGLHSKQQEVKRSAA
jgi:hypothetical protein